MLLASRSPAGRVDSARCRVAGRVLLASRSPAGRVDSARCRVAGRVPCARAGSLARDLLCSRWRASGPSAGLGTGLAVQQVACQRAERGAWHGTCCAAGGVPAGRARGLARDLLCSRWRASGPSAGLGTGLAVQQVACQRAERGAWHGTCCAAGGVPADRARGLARELLCSRWRASGAGRGRAGPVAGHMLNSNSVHVPCHRPGPAPPRPAGTPPAAQQFPCQAPRSVRWHATCCTASPVPSPALGPLARHLLHSKSRAKPRARPAGTPPAAQQVPCQAPRSARWHATCCTASPVPSPALGPLARHLLHSKSRAKPRARPAGTPPAAQQVPCQAARPGAWHATCYSTPRRVHSPGRRAAREQHATCYSTPRRVHSPGRRAAREQHATCYSTPRRVHSPGRRAAREQHATSAGKASRARASNMPTASLSV